MTCRVPQLMKNFAAVIAVIVVKIPDFEWQGTAKTGRLVLIKKKLRPID